VAVRGLKVADLMAHDACKLILIGDHVAQAFENADLPTGQGEGVERTNSLLSRAKPPKVRGGRFAEMSRHFSAACAAASLAFR